MFFMIDGIDVGNSLLKDADGIICATKCSKTPNLLTNQSLTVDGETYYMGEGEYDTHFQKADKEHYLIYLYYALARCNAEVYRVVVALPISQWNKDKDRLKEKILSRKKVDLRINNIKRAIYIDDCYVAPEGVVGLTGTDFEGIFVDIGGLTTEAGEIYIEGGEQKVKNALSIPTGILNLHAQFIKRLNDDFPKAGGLEITDAERIIEKGLWINGEQQKADYAKQVYKSFTDKLVSDLRLNYKLNTRDVIIMGGGGELLFDVLQKEIPQCYIKGKSVLANAIGCKRKGEEIWGSR